MIYSPTMVYYLIKFPLYAGVFNRVDTIRMERESMGRNSSLYQYNLNDNLDCVSLTIKHIIDSSGIRDSDWLEENPKSNLNRVFDNPVGAIYYAGVCVHDPN
jgi:hypothetical protein